MHRLGELALEAYEQAGQSMLLCRLHWDTMEREVYQQDRRWHNPLSEGNLCLWRAMLGQLPLEVFQSDQAEKVKLELCNHGAAHAETLVRSLGGNLEQMAGNFKRMLAPCELADENALVAISHYLQRPLVVFEAANRVAWLFAPTDKLLTVPALTFCNQDTHFG
eukprot:75692-Amphidinium_carterae.1